MRQNWSTLRINSKSYDIEENPKLITNNSKKHLCPLHYRQHQRETKSALVRPILGVNGIDLGGVFLVNNISLELERGSELASLRGY